MAETKRYHAQQELAKKAESLKKEAKGIAHLDSRDESAYHSRIRLLRRKQVEILTGVSRSSLYSWIKRGEFPQPVKLGTRLVAWRESDVVAWLESREVREA